MHPLFRSTLLALLLCAGTAVAQPVRDPIRELAQGGEEQTTGDVAVGLLTDELDSVGTDRDHYRFQPVVLGPVGETFACLFLVMTTLFSVAYLLKADSHPSMQ